MHEILSKAQTSLSRQRSMWYRALTLTERAEMKSSSDLTSTPPENGAGASCLAEWRAQTPFQEGDIFQERLVLDHLTEEDLCTLLNASPDLLQIQQYNVPAWLAFLQQSMNERDTDDKKLSDHPPATLFDILIPLVQPEIDRLHEGLQRLTHKHEVLPFDPQHIMHVLIDNLKKQCLPKAHKTLILEMHVARVQGYLQGDTPEERFAFFIEHLCQPAHRLKLFEEYPVLARQIVESAERWSRFSLTFLTHLCEDWPDIRTSLAPQDDAGLLVEATAGAGDSHRGGQSVLLLRFSSGWRLLYKPRSLSVDVHFQALLKWLNERGFTPQLQIIRVLDYSNHGWTEYINAQSCTTHEQVERFYQRQGGYLALLYALEATDFHAENLIAAGEHPVLVDLEALFHPRIRRDTRSSSQHPALETMQRSVLRVGLLPSRIWETEQEMGVDVSGLGGQKGQLTPLPVPQWQEVGTDRMHLIRQRMEIQERKNRPKFQDQDVHLIDYKKQLVLGFQTMYQLLQEQHKPLIAGPLASFASDEVRLILRHTRTYALLLAESFHPDVLRDALDREQLFDKLWLGIDHQPELKQVLTAERLDLHKGDIPLFTTSPTSHAILTSQGEQINDFFEQCSLKNAEECLQNLCSQDLKKQIWLIEASLATMSMEAENWTSQAPLPTQSEGSLSHQRLLEHAKRIGDRLEELCLRNEQGADWIGIGPGKGASWNLQSSDLDLYSGTSGIALFLAYLGKLTREARYTDLAMLTVQTIRSQLEQAQTHLKWSHIGAFGGLSGPIYLFTHLSQLWHDPSLLVEAEEIVSLITPLIKEDTFFDSIAGTASYLHTLLALYEVHPAQTVLAAAIECGDHLLANAQTTTTVGIGWYTPHEETPLAGFSHGNAGIALALLRLKALTGHHRFFETALAALDYERSLFVSEKGNWRDMRSFPQQTKESNPTAPEKQAFMTSWCHGAPGIALARMASLPYIDTAMLREEIRVGPQTTLSEGFRGNHSLCHGTFGNLDILLYATQTFKDHVLYQEEVQRLTLLLLTSIEQQGWRCGVPQEVETPGLMTGLAGIGFALLRLAYPTEVPTVLLLDPPLHQL